MGYFMDTWRFLNSNEYEYKYLGEFGRKGEKRKKREKPTPEQMKLQNQRNREKKIRRLIKANFAPGDLWTTLKYREGVRKTLEEIQKDMKNFWDRMRRAYKKVPQELKFIARYEVGGRGGIHIHILINRLRGGDTDLLVQEKWTHGRASFQSIYESGGYEGLACYIVKQPEEESPEYEQLSLFPEEEQKALCRYSTSRNLVRPQPERKEYHRWTMRGLLEKGPEPTPGFYIDKSSIRTGVNPYTGMSYFYYTENRVKQIRAADPPGEGREPCTGRRNAGGHKECTKKRRHRADKRHTVGAVEKGAVPGTQMAAPHPKRRKKE